MTATITATALNEWLQDEQRPKPIMLDVREDHELAIASMPGITHIPMATVAEQAHTLDSQQSIVCICHHGRRAQAVADWLENNGFSNVSVLVGGIHDWSQAVDPTVPTY